MITEKKISVLLLVVVWLQPIAYAQQQVDGPRIQYEIDSTGAEAEMSNYPDIYDQVFDKFVKLSGCENIFVVDTTTGKRNAAIWIYAGGSSSALLGTWALYWGVTSRQKRKKVRIGKNVRLGKNVKINFKVSGSSATYARLGKVFAWGSGVAALGVGLITYVRATAEAAKDYYELPPRNLQEQLNALDGIGDVALRNHIRLEVQRAGSIGRVAHELDQLVCQ